MGACEFSPCRRWRYSLARRWNIRQGNVQFIGLNPSYANEITEDNTVRKCMAFAQRWGHGGMCMTNLFAFVATDPAEMKMAESPVEETPGRNDAAIRRALDASALVVVMWGNHGSHLGRADAVRALVRAYAPHTPLMCFGENASGEPTHPLYLPNATKLREHTKDKA